MGHRNLRLCAKVLHDHFLNVTVLFMHLADRQQRVDPFLHRFADPDQNAGREDRKSTRLNSSHGYISYAVFCLKKKKKQTQARPPSSFKTSLCIRYTLTSLIL